MPSYFVEVQAPQARAQTSANLLASAQPGTGDDWENGLSFLGEMCPVMQVFDACAVPAAAPASQASLTFIAPQAYRLHTECSTLEGARSLGVARDRLARQAEAVASFALARELWEGAGTRATPFADPFGGSGIVNPFFGDGNAEQLTGALNPLHALGLLEQAARDTTMGMQVFLHIPISIATQVAAQLFRHGNELRTATDAIVIADAGYTGSGPRDTGTAEVQTVTITGAPTGGTFTLTATGYGTTGPIAFNASAATVSGALSGIFGPGKAVVTGANGGPWTVTFSSSLGNVPQMTATSSLTGGTAPAVTVTTGTPGVTPAPAAGVWGYATGPVFTRLGTLAYVDSPAQTIDRRTNTRTVWADRMFAAGYDPCASVAIQFPEP